MKKLKQFYLVSILLMLSLVGFSQTNYGDILNYQDVTDPASADRATGGTSYLGGVFTPKGTLKVLIIYAGFKYNSEIYEEPNTNWPSNGGTGLPDYITYETYDLLFSNVSQLDDPQYADKRNLTRFYNEASLGSFTLLGDVLRDPANIPVRININPTASNPDFPYAPPSSGAAGWEDMNKRVLFEASKLYPTYDLSPFDNRTNHNSTNGWYTVDDTQTSGDNRPDYVVIFYRYSPSWTNQPVAGMSDWLGSGGGFSVLSGANDMGSNWNWNGYTFDESGYTQTLGMESPLSNVALFAHEVAHELYDCPHLMGANSAIGDYFYFPRAGWGMMASNVRSMLTANSWERWLLGWHELIDDDTQENYDIKSIDDLNSTGEYILEDFITEGDMMRIKIPNVEHTYLWIENHQKISDMDFKPWAGENPSQYVSSSTIPDFEKGVYMFLENTEDNRENFTLSVAVNYNSIKPLNAQGNYDYTHSDYPFLDPNDQTRCDPRYYWNNITYTFQQGASNPISGTNPWYSFIDDYPEYVKSGNYWVFNSEKNDNIKWEGSYYNGAKFENATILCETDGASTELLYAHSFGRNAEAESMGRRSDAFQAGDEVSLSGIIPALNIPQYDFSNEKNNPYILNGLSVKILEQYPDGSIKIKIRFDDYEINNDKRWTGNIELPNSSADENPDLIVNTGVTLTVNKSGIPNRRTAISDDEDMFINPTVFTCLENSKLTMQEASTVIIEDKSSMVLDNNSSLEINDNAQLIIRTGCNLMLREGCYVDVYNGGNITIEDGAYICIEEGANINLSDANSMLILKTGARLGSNPDLSISGNCSNGCIQYLGNGKILYEDKIITATSITGNVEMSGRNILISNNLTVENTGVLTINNSNLTFDGFKKITIKTGGKLIVDNSTISSSCSGFWQGIVAELGSEVTIRNGSKIENAETGVFVREEANLNATDATFKNNKVAVEIEDGNGETFKFIRCDFLSDDYLLTAWPAAHYCHVILNYASDATFEGCTFKNLSPGSFTTEYRGTGIQTYGLTNLQIKSKCLTSVDCQNPIKTVFENLNYGIDCSGTGEYMSYIKIDKCEFKNNFRGALLANFNNLDVTSNTFYVGNINDNYDIYDFSLLYQDEITAYGLYLSGCTNYKVEANFFLNGIGVNSNLDNAIVGLALENYGAESNVVYRNRFAYLPYATSNMYNYNIVRSADNNAKEIGYLDKKGVVYDCNNFFKNIYSLSASGRYGLNYYQGSSENPVGNIFDHRCNYSGGVEASDLYLDPMNDYASISYYYYNGNNAGASQTNPFCKTDVVNTYEVAIPFIDIEACPSNLGGKINGNNLPLALDEIKSQTIVLRQAETSLEHTIDGGNTTNLLRQIEHANNIANVERKLLRASPYLSEEVMGALAANDNYEAQMVTDVLVENPHSANSSYVAEQLAERTDALSNDMIYQILANKEVPSEMNNLISSVSNLELERDELLGDLVKYYLSDTIPENDTILIDVYTQIKTFENTFNLVSLYLRLDRPQDALNLLSQIPSMFPLTDNETTEYNKLNTYYTILANLKLEDRSVQEITESEKQELYTLAEDYSSRASSLSRAILTQVDNIPFNEKIVLPRTVEHDTLLITGNVYSCGNTPAAGLNLYFTDEQGNISTVTEPFTTDANGMFTVTIIDINPFDALLQLTISTSTGETLIADTYQTIEEWSNTEINVNFSYEITVEESIIEPTCGNNNGSIGLTISGGIEPYTFTWSNGANTPFLTNIPEGDYTITITDAGGCQVENMYELTSSLTAGMVKNQWKISETEGNFNVTLDNNDRFGSAIACIGDLNQDGVKDMLVGAAFDDDGSQDNGAAYVLFMNTDRTVQSQHKISYPEIPTGSLGIFGNRIDTIGDLDMDGLTEVAIGAEWDFDGGPYHGALWITSLNTDGTVKWYQKISDLEGGFEEYIPSNGSLGSACAPIGDFDNDGVNDIVVGMRRQDNNMGAIYLMYLNANGTVKNYTKIGNNIAGFNAGLNPYDQFGTSIANLGDLDGDGVIDLAVGAYRDSDDGTDKGAVWILFLNADGTVKNFNKISDNVFEGVLQTGDYFGVSVENIRASEDINGDGVVDLIVGAVFTDDGGIDVGAVWVLFMNSDGSVNDFQKISGTEGCMTGLSSGDRFGASVNALGDFANDGTYNIAVGASLDDDGGADKGAVWILELERAEPMLSARSAIANTDDENNADGRSVNGIQEIITQENGEERAYLTIDREEVNFKIFPNPYRENTTINYELKEESQMSLEVYTLTGQHIHTIYNGNQNKGNYRYDFSAKKLGYAAGTYMLRIVINEDVNSYWLIELN